MKFAMILILILAVVLATPHLNYAKIVGVWLFDEASGKIVNDASGNGLDGEELGTRVAGPKPATNKAPLMIGAQPPKGGGPLKGMIDEVAVYDTALDEKEIQSIMNGLAAKFKFVIDHDGKLATEWAKIKKLTP